MAILPVNTTVVSETADSEKTNYMPALITLGILYFMMGLITCLNDTLVPFFKRGFNLSYAESSLVQFYFFLTYGIMSIPAGKIVGKIGYKNGMVLGFSIAAFGAILFFPASILHVYFLFLAALFIVAIGIVILQVAANPYVTILGPARTASSRLTLIQGVGSIGTTVAPVLGAYFILSRIGDTASSDAVKYPYLVIAAVLIIIAISVAKLKLPTVKTEHAASSTPLEESRSIFSYRNLNFGSIAIFVYVGAEVSIGTFLTNYISHLLNIEIAAANSFVAFYWGSMVIGRLLGAIILKTLKPSHVLSFCAVMCMVLIAISLSNDGYLAVWSMIAVGLFNSVMFAIIFSLSINGLGKNTTQASGILSTAIVGGAIISYSQGILLDHYSWTLAFLLPVFCYVYILFFGLNGYRSQHQVA